LRERILSGHLRAGDPLPEEELSRGLGISRIPLREALRRLQAEGLVTLRPRRGAVVASIDPSEVTEIAEACRLLECHALRLAHAGIDAALLERAEELVERLDRITDPAEWSQVNWSLHTTLYAPAGRPFQLRLLDSLRIRAERAMLVLVADAERRRRLNLEHREILKALRRRQRARSIELLDAHLAGGGDEALRLLE